MSVSPLLRVGWRFPSKKAESKLASFGTSRLAIEWLSRRKLLFDCDGPGSSSLYYFHGDEYVGHGDRQQLIAFPNPR